MPLYLALIYSCNSVPDLVSPSLCIFLGPDKEAFIPQSQSTGEELLFPQNFPYTYLYLETTRKKAHPRFWLHISEDPRPHLEPLRRNFPCRFTFGNIVMEDGGAMFWQCYSASVLLLCYITLT